MPLSAAAIALVGGAGLLFHSTLPRTGRLRAGMFCFYTNLSNLLIVVWELALALAAVLAPAGGAYRLLAAPDVALAMTACIWVTHLIFHFVLLPYGRRHRRGGGEPRPRHTAGDMFGNACVHYVTPGLVLAQWALLADKSGLGVRSAAQWLALPLAYFLFAMVRGASGKPIGNTALRYPYPFLDRPALGPRRFWLGIAGLLAFFFALGLALVGAARLLA